MKSKNYWVLFPLCFVLVFYLGGCQKGTQEEPEAEENVTPSPEQTEFEQLITANKGMQKRMEDKKYKNMILTSLKDQIKEDNENLKEYFEKEKFGNMAALSKMRSTKLVGPNYERISGDEINDFWMKRVDKDKELHIETVHIYLSDFIGEKEVQIGEKKDILDATALVVRMIRIVSKGEGGEVLKNATLMETSTYLHRHGCPWE